MGWCPLPSETRPCGESAARSLRRQDLLVSRRVGDRVERVHLAVSVPGVVSRATLTRGECVALGADAEEALVRRRKEDGARLRICRLVEVRLYPLGAHLSFLRALGVAETADDQRGDTGDVRRSHRSPLQVTVDDGRLGRIGGGLLHATRARLARLPRREYAPDWRPHRATEHRVSAARPPLPPPHTDAP